MAEKREVVLNPSGLDLAEQKRHVWHVVAAYGTTRADIENPGYWAHVAGRLRPKARIEVHAEDDSFYAEYMVTSCDKTWAKIVNLLFIDLTKTSITKEQEQGINDAYEVTFRGPKKWSVVRKSDRAVLQEGLHSRDDGEKWLAVHLNAQGIAA